MNDHGRKPIPKDPKHDAPDKALLEAKPDWDRMGEIADRLLSTPPNRQAVGKAVAPKPQRRPRI